MKNRINLFIPKEKNVADKIIYFVLNYLRYILIITQLVVIGVFFYRFRIDQEIVDLKEELSQKQEIVTVSAPLVEEAKILDNKIKIVKNVLDRQDSLVAMVDYLFARFPDKVKLDSLKIEESGINFNGVTEDPRLLKAFLARLQAEKKFKTIQLTNIQKSLSGYTFAFNLKDFIL